jgi:hypothetical protein
MASKVSSSTPVAHLQQYRIEDRLLGRRMQFEERRQPAPNRGQHPGVGAIDLLQDRENPALLVVVVKDQLGNVHGPSRHRISGSLTCPQAADDNASPPTLSPRRPARLEPIALARLLGRTGELAAALAGR